MNDVYETNRRLNRRCQRLEKLVAKYRRRYVAVQKPMEAAERLADRYVTTLHKLWKAEHKLHFSPCFWCRLKRWFKQKMRGW